MGTHAFDRVCTANRSEHRLTKPRTPQTNGMIERFNGRIAEVLVTTRFDSAEHFTDTIKRSASPASSITFNPSFTSKRSMDILR